MNDVDKLKELISSGEHLISIRATSEVPEFSSWRTNVERFLTRKYGDKSVELRQLKNRPFGPMTRIGRVPHDDSIECVRDIRATIFELEGYLKEENEEEKPVSEQSTSPAGRVFIVHGHDGEIREAVARLLEKQGIEPIILNEQANQGQTIIEKFERHADVSAAIALFTNDDTGSDKDSDDVNPRARQNVVFEAGYFMGKLGRSRVIIIAEKGNEIPSDLQGVVYTDRENWKFDVCKELSAMGYAIDLNKFLKET